MVNLIYNKNINEAQRLFHGRGKGHENLSELNIDYFPPIVLLTFYKEPKLDVLYALQTQLLSISDLNIKSILIQKRYLPKSPVENIFGESILEHIAMEGLLKYSIKLGPTQNIGFFLDMKLGRELIQKYAKNKKVLNLFSYTCAFSVVALKYGANEVVNIDMSKAALSRGKENHLLNQIPSQKSKYFAHDILKSFGLLKRLSPFDFIIIDPPSDHGSHFLVDRDYPKLISRLKDWTNPGAFIMTCLNSPFHSFAYLENCIAQFAPDLELIEKIGAPPTFMETNPDRGLKIILWKRRELNES